VFGLGQVSLAAELSFAVHPILTPEQTQKSYTPLLKYLEKKSGHRFKLVNSKNLFAHWNAFQREQYDFILDGPHFTDFRIQRQQYEVLVKFPSVVSYSLVTHVDMDLFEPGELIAKRIATTPSPALGALWLFKIYPNPLRQPTLMAKDDSIAAAEMLNQGKVEAAMIPTPMVGRYPDFSNLVSTNQVPAPAVSASPKVEPELRKKIKQLLLDLPNSDEGKKVLEALNTEGLVATSAQEYKGHSELLEGMWGY
jgi:phosphonate transport system substrate-binding protein